MPGYCDPPNRFSSTNQPLHRGRPKGTSPTEWLRKLAKTKIDFQNPLTGKPDKAPVALVVAIQLILKATQDSDLPSIKEFFDRMDGKVAQEILGKGLADTVYHVINFNGNGKPKDSINTSSRVSGIDTPLADRNP